MPEDSDSPLQPKLRKKQGVWVYSCGERLSAEQVREAIRDTREQRCRAGQRRLPSE